MEGFPFRTDFLSSFLMRFKVQNTHLWGLDCEDKSWTFALVIE